MANVIGNLVIRLSADATKVNAAMAGAQAKLSKLGVTAGSTGAKLSKWLTVPLIGLGAAGVAAAMDVGSGMRIIKQQTGETGATLKKLGDDYRATLAKVPQSAKEVGTVMSDLHRRTDMVGVPLRNLGERILTLGRITGVDTANLVRTGTRAFADWGIATKDQGKSLDFLYGISAKTGINIGSLMDTVSKFGSPMRSLGISFETTAALAGRFEQSGVRAELAMGGLRMGLARLAKAGKDPQKEFPKLMAGIKNAGSAAEANKLAIELFGARAGPDLAAAIREGKFEIDDLVKSLKKSPKSIMKVGADTMTLSQKFKLLKNQVSLALEPLGAALIDIFKKIWPVISTVIRSMTGLIKVFGKLPAPVKIAVLALAGIAALAGPFGAVVGAIKHFGLVIGQVFARLAFTIMSNPIILVIGVIVAAIVGLGYLIYKNWDKISKFLSKAWNWIKGVAIRVWTAIVDFFRPLWEPIVNFFRRNWETIKAVLQTVWNTIITIGRVVWNVFKTYFVVWLRVVGTVFKVGWAVIKTVLVAAWKVIKAVAGPIWNAIKLNFLVVMTVIKTAFKVGWAVIKTILVTAWNLIKAAAQVVWLNIKIFIITPIMAVWEFLTMCWNGIKGFLEGVWNAISAVASAVWGVIKAVVTTVWDGITAVWSAVWGAISGVVSAVWNAIVNAWHTIIDPVVEAAKKVWDALAGIWDSVWGGLKDAIAKVWNFIKDKVSWITDALSKLKNLWPGNWFGGGGSKRGDIHNGPGMAAGGVATKPILTWLAEKEPELVIPLSKAERMFSMAGGGGGAVNLTVHLNSVSPEYDVQRFAKLARKVLDDEFKRGRHLRRTMIDNA